MAPVASHFPGGNQEGFFDLDTKAGVCGWGFPRAKDIPVGLHVMYLLLLPDFIQKWNTLTNVNKTSQ
jgi:hypothetical protein